MAARNVRSAWLRPPPLLPGYTRPLPRRAANELVKTLLAFGYRLRPSNNLMASVYSEYCALTRTAPASPDAIPVFLYLATRSAVRKTLVDGQRIETVGEHRA